MKLLPTQRHLFDIPQDIAYFNCAYNAPLLREAGAALTEGALSKCHPWNRTPSDFFEPAEEFRRLAARAFGGDSDCYAVIPSASYGTSAVGRIFETILSKGDEILVLDEAFPSNYLPWLRASETTGANLIIAPTPQDLDWTRAVLDRITSKTKLVAVPNCHWTNGAILDLEAIADATRSVGASLVLEVTQSLGAMPLDLDRVRPDFMIAAGYKWLLFPYGLSLFYAAPQWHHARPLEETWLGRDGAEAFENLVNYTDQYQPGARRFDMGQKSIPTLLPAGLVGLRQLGDWGIETIATSLRSINERIAQLLEPVGFQPVPEAFRSPHILGASSAKALSPSITADLAARKIYISRRGNALRFAPHLHVTESDLEHLADAIKTLCL
nr:aminotransferase class V-fold PLP-dependent enzyme [uncultured Cohaesibacter sp.]